MVVAKTLPQGQVNVISVDRGIANVSLVAVRKRVARSKRHNPRA
jgi:hypothetical protein